MRLCLRLLRFQRCFLYILWLSLSSLFWKLFNDLHKSEDNNSMRNFEPVGTGSQVVNSNWSYLGKGKPFSSKSVAWLESLKLDDAAIASIDDEAVLRSKPVFVTAFSQNHFREAKFMIWSLQRYFPDAIVHVFDLGLRSKKVDYLKACTFIRYCRFPYETYPDSFRILYHYRWKPVIIAKMLAKYPSIWWFDTSASLKDGNISRVIDKISKGEVDSRGYPIQLFGSAGHSTYAVTHPTMYKYLPIDVTLTKGHQFQASPSIFFGTTKVIREVLRWWVLCAFEPECMAPRGAQERCHFGENRFDQFANCHRFDQSALNILLLRASNGNREAFSNPGAGLFERIDLKSSNKTPSLFCPHMPRLGAIQIILPAENNHSNGNVFRK